MCRRGSVVQRCQGCLQLAQRVGTPSLQGQCSKLSLLYSRNKWKWRWCCLWVHGIHGKEKKRLISNRGSSLWPGLFVTMNPEMPEPEVRRHRTSSAEHSWWQGGSSTPRPARVSRFSPALGRVGGIQPHLVHPSVSNSREDGALPFGALYNAGCWEYSEFP